MSQELYGLVNQSSLVGIKVLSPVETARKYIAELRPKVDLLVAVTHQGVDDDSVLAQEAPGLDIIIGGHSHTRFENAQDRERCRHRADRLELRESRGA